MHKNHNIYSQQEEIQLTDLVLTISNWIRYLKTKIVWLMGLLAMGILMGAVISIFSSKDYAAKVTFVLDEQNQSNPLGNLGGLAAFGVNTAAEGNLFAGDNLIWLYTSNKMLEETLMTSVEGTEGKCNLLSWLLKMDKDLIEVNEKLKKNNSQYNEVSCSSKLDQLNVSQRKLLVVATNIIRKNYLNVSMENKTTGIISVVVSSSDEAFSLNFARELVNKVNTFYINTKTQKNKAQVEILQTKVDEVAQQMSSSMYAAASAADNVPYANPNQQSLKVSAQRKVVDVQASSAIYEVMVQQLEAAKITLEKETPLIQIVDNPQLPLPVVKPSLILYTVGFGFLFLVLGVGFFLVRRYYKEILAKANAANS